MYPFKHWIACSSLLICLAGLGVVGGCITMYQDDPARFAETRNLTVAHQPGMPVRVATSNGAITIQRGPVADVLIKAELKATSEPRLANTRIIAERREGALVVEVAWADNQRKGSEGCSFEITVPDAKDVDARTSNGSIHLTSLAGQAHANTANGAITITAQDGPVEARTSNGAVRVKASTGAIIAETANGSIEIEDARQPVQANTNNSRIKVHLTDDNPGPVRLETSNGSIDLRVGKAFAGQLNMSTSNGSVDFSSVSNARQVSVHKNAAHLVFGNSNAVSEVHTSNGSIHFIGLQN
ncbi:MAG TPA: DUF4097 family beta strand repeat-containing protein [Tepidisphaeraceae bacterium]|nr:DUF4097 family beta strand repeat-containing protein [Tepidisphaeraceae bacterium]